MPIGSCWASGSWTDGVWADFTWADAIVLIGVIQMITLQRIGD